jgi:glycosyltransferase involved in cell wall biosynthesis
VLVLYSSTVNLQKVDAQQLEINTKPHIRIDAMGKSIQGFAPSPLKTSQKKVSILLATFQGQGYLEEQLHSYLDQSHQNWELWVSDDGSSDQTLAILADFKNKLPKNQMSIHFGPQQGFAANFLSLTCHVDILADYYAYSDQDDVWKKEKLAKAVSWLESVPDDIPALYCGRTCLVDKHKNEIGLSPLFAKPPSFANALIQNIGGGNTMVLNNAARRLLQAAGECIPVIAHDWWAYMLISGSGGRVFYDSTPMLIYRQHENNLVGMNNSWPARLKRIRMLWQGRFKEWNDTNVMALESTADRLTPENQSVLEQFTAARQMGLLRRLIHFKRSGIYRQTLLGNIGLIVAAVLGKL